MLAGVGSVVIMDDTPASAAPATNFLVPADTPRDSPVAEACVRTLQAMNPLVNVSRATGNLTALTAADLKAKCDILVMAAAGVALADVAAANSLAHAAGVRFIAAAVRGPNSYAFVDLGRHTYTPKVQTKAPAAGSTESTSGKAAADGAEAAAGAAAATAPQAPVDIDYVRFEQAMAVPAAQLKKRTHGLYGVLRGEAPRSLANKGGCVCGRGVSHCIRCPAAGLPALSRMRPGFKPLTNDTPG